MGQVLDAHDWLIVCRAMKFSATESTSSIADTAESAIGKQGGVEGLR